MHPVVTLENVHRLYDIRIHLESNGMTRTI